MKRWSTVKRDYVENKRVDVFLRELRALCWKHQLCISHEDTEGAFEVHKFEGHYVDHMEDANICF